MILKRFLRLGLCVLLVGAVAGCGSKKPERPRTSAELFAAEQQLPTLFITVDSHKQIKHAGSTLFVDPETGEVAWPALACQNPDCPGRGADGEPYLFIDPDTTIVALPDGTVGTDPTNTDITPDPSQRRTVSGCPKCMELRDPGSESLEEREQYALWVQPYVLPETAAARAAIEEERRQRAQMKHLPP